MLVLYSQFLQFPGGSPAANHPVPVYARASNQLAPLFTDQEGMTPASNPYTTDGDGHIVFYAAPGEYETLLAGSYMRIPLDESVTEPVWGAVVVHEESTPSSVWTVRHFFGIRPSVDVRTAQGETVAEVEHPDALTTVITFGTEATGTAYLRR